MGTLPSRKHLGRALLRFKIALSLESRGILKKSAFYVDFRSKNRRDFAFKVVLLEGVVSERVAPLIFENRAPVRDILKLLRLSCSMVHQKLRSRARQFDFLAFVIIFLSSKIALPCGASLKFRRFIFIRFHQNDAPVRSIRKILIIYER